MRFRWHFLKELDVDYLIKTVEALNTWWREEGLPEEVLKARVVPIFKKGDSGNMSTYRQNITLHTKTSLS